MGKCIVAVDGAAYSEETGEICVGPCRFERRLILCADCDFFPEPDGIAHVCRYWQRLTNERGWCSNARPKEVKNAKAIP